MSLLTTLMGLVKPQDNDNSRAHLGTPGAGYHANMDKLDAHTHDNDTAGAAVKRVASGLDAGKPVAGNAGRVYVATDTGLMYVDTGTAWIALNLHGAGSITDAMLVSIAGGKVVGAVATATAATHANGADTASLASLATHAATADNATHAANADNATHANGADTASLASLATHAGDADHATNADLATLATNALWATGATNASRADNADHATSADSANSATTAGHTPIADYAITATDADNANLATNALWATGATNAARADNADHATIADALTHVPSCRVFHSVSQAVANATTVSLDFNTELFDTDAIHDLSTNISCLTCKTAGIYLITAAVQWSDNPTGGRTIELLRNASYIIAHQYNDASDHNMPDMQRLSTIYSLAVNDYVQLRVSQGSGASLSVLSGAHYSPAFSMVRLGPAA